jgi:hypothetical protein
VKHNFGGVEHFIKGVREILGPPSKSAHDSVRNYCAGEGCGHYAFSLKG